MVYKKGSKGEVVKQIQKVLGITADGIFGQKTEDAVKKYQKEHNLTADGIVGEKTLAKMGMGKTEDLSIGDDVIYNPIGKHITKSNGRKIEYLVIHYTAGASSKVGSAASTRSVFVARDASADFVVDDKDIVQINPDIKNNYTWAVGDGNGKYGITNKNSISIEMCSNLKKGYSGKYPNHEGWYFTEDTINNTIKLAKIIMDKYNIDIKHVVRHYDASHKLCPGIVGWNPGNILDQKTGKTIKPNNEDEWLDFIDKLSKQK